MLTEPDRRELDTAPPHNRETKIAGIEMLRALAVLLVLFQHLPGMLPQLALLWLPGKPLTHFNGSAGVDIFFCISGFVVARSLQRDMAGLARRPALTVAIGFWIRRAFRLWPSAWLWLPVAFFVSLAFNRLGVQDPWVNLQMIPAGIGMYSNYWMIHASKHHQTLGIMSQYWSLSLEEQFYLVLPVLLILSRRAALPVLLFYTACRFLDYRDFWSDIYLRPGCLVAGVVLARLEGGVLWCRLQGVWRPNYVGPTVCGTLMLAACIVDAIAPYERWLGVAMFRLQAPLETMLCFLIVLIAVQCSADARLGAVGRGLVFLGSRSYAIYVVHQLAYAVTREIDFRLFSETGHVIPRLAVALPTASALIACATEATFRFVEWPMRSRGGAVAKRLLAEGFGEILRSCDAAIRSRRRAWPKREGSSRILDIELLRAVAIVFVMIEHVDYNLLFSPHALPWVLRFGEFWPGVDLFFVISGFLVTRDLLRRLDTQAHWSRGWRATQNFWFRRAWRLWPTAWLWLAAVVVGSALFTDQLPFFGPFKANVQGFWAGMFFYANLRSVHVVWDPYGASFPYWSLSLEEQFYFVLPLLMLLLGRFLPVAALVCIAVQFPLAHSRFYYFFRSDALLWGVILAAWYGRGSYLRMEPKLLANGAIAGIVLFCGLAGLFRLAGPGNAAPAFVIGAIAAISAVLVWIASYDRNYLCPDWGRGLVSYVGSRSYALYVAHVPVFNCSAALAHYVFTPSFHPFTGAGDWYALAVVGPMLLASTELTYRCVEQPLRRIGARLTSRSALLAA